LKSRKEHEGASGAANVSTGGWEPQQGAGPKKYQTTGGFKSAYKTEGNFVTKKPPSARVQQKQKM